MSSVSDQLREAIQRYGTVYALSRDSGISQPVIGRFLHGQRGLKLATVDRLCEFFEMHLTRPKRRPQKRRR